MISKVKIVTIVSVKRDKGKKLIWKVILNNQEGMIMPNGSTNNTAGAIWGSISFLIR